jgi:hypothetical protein
MTDTADRLGYWAKAGGHTATSNNSSNPDHSEGPVVRGQLDPDKPFPWGGTIEEQQAAHQARYGIPIGFGPINGEARQRDLTALYAKLGWQGPATLTDHYDLQVVDGLAEAVDAAAGTAANGTSPVPEPVLPPSPPTSPPVPAHPAAGADAHGAANAHWQLVVWPALRPALISTHGVVVAPAVRQAIYLANYPLYLAAADAGLIGPDGKLVT